MIRAPVKEECSAESAVFFWTIWGDIRDPLATLRSKQLCSMETPYLESQHFKQLHCDMRISMKSARALNERRPQRRPPEHKNVRSEVDSTQIIRNILREIRP